MRIVLRGSTLRFTGQKPQVLLHLLIVSISMCEGLSAAAARRRKTARPVARR
jgi:hypothetical protein